MGLLSDRLKPLLRAGNDLRFRVETIARVGNRLGIHRAMTLPGATVLARELSRLRATPSTLYRYHASNNPDRVAMIQAGLPGRKDANEARRLRYAEVDELADRVAIA